MVDDNSPIVKIDRRDRDRLIIVEAIVRELIDKWRHEAAAIGRHPSRQGRQDEESVTFDVSMRVRETLADELEEAMGWVKPGPTFTGH